MPSKLPKVNLGDVEPTKEEIEKAQALLKAADEKSKRSKMASMTHFVRESKDTDALNSRGDHRQKYLLKFLVHQLRAKNAESKTATERSVASGSERFRDVHWYMDSPARDPAIMPLPPTH